MVRFITAREVHELADYAALVEGFKRFHLEDVDEVRDIHLSQPGPSGTDNVFLALPAWQRDEAVGIKLVTVFPDNEYTGTGLPSVQGVYALFDGKDGKPLALIDGIALTLRKTAADSATGASFLAREDARSMLMVGAGAMAPHLIMAMKAVRPSLEVVRIWNRTPERASALARRLAIDSLAVGSDRRSRGDGTKGRYHQLCHHGQRAPDSWRLARQGRPSRPRRKLPDTHARKR